MHLGVMELFREHSAHLAQVEVVDQKEAAQAAAFHNQFSVFENFWLNDHAKTIQLMMSPSERKKLTRQEETLYLESAPDMSDQITVFETIWEGAREKGNAHLCLELSQTLMLIPNDRDIGARCWKAINNFARQTCEHVIYGKGQDRNRPAHRDGLPTVPTASWTAAWNLTISCPNSKRWKKP